MFEHFWKKFEKAVHLLCKYLPKNDKDSKPVLFHSIRVGVYLYENGYDEDVVIAGLLHDIIEDTSISRQELIIEFNINIANIVIANSKNKSIPNQDERIDELMNW